MQRTARPRSYISPGALYALRPFLRYSYDRSAYVLRFVGETKGPVLRPDRRRDQRDFGGHERREAVAEAGMSSLGRMA
jgi:hypothetical protein